MEKPTLHKILESLWKEMESEIKKNGCSGLTLCIESSIYDIKEIMDEKDKEILWLYGKLNMISDIIEKGRSEKVGE